MTNWYKAVVGTLTLADVMPDFARDPEFLRLDAERERLAREYEAADGALLNAIAARLRRTPLDHAARRSNYFEGRVLPGDASWRERMHIADGEHVPVMRFSRSAVYRFTHCPVCDALLSRCGCPTEEERLREREAYGGWNERGERIGLDDDDTR